MPIDLRRFSFTSKRGSMYADPMENPIVKLRDLRAKARETFDKANSYEDSVLVWVVGMAAAAIGLMVHQGVGSLGPLGRFGFALLPTAISAGLLSRVATRFLMRRDADRWVNRDSTLVGLEARAEVAMMSNPGDVVEILEEAKGPGQSAVSKALGVAGDILFLVCVLGFLAGLWILVVGFWHTNAPG